MIGALRLDRDEARVHSQDAGDRTADRVEVGLIPVRLGGGIPLLHERTRRGGRAYGSEPGARGPVARRLRSSGSAVWIHAATATRGQVGGPKGAGASVYSCPATLQEFRNANRRGEGKRHWRGSNRHRGRYRHRTILSKVGGLATNACWGGRRSHALPREGAPGPLHATSSSAERTSRVQ